MAWIIPIRFHPIRFHQIPSDFIPFYPEKSWKLDNEFMNSAGQLAPLSLINRNSCFQFHSVSFSFIQFHSVSSPIIDRFPSPAPIKKTVYDRRPPAPRPSPCSIMDENGLLWRLAGQKTAQRQSLAAFIGCPRRAWHHLPAARPTHQPMAQPQFKPIQWTILSLPHQRI